MITERYRNTNPSESLKKFWGDELVCPVLRQQTWECIRCSFNNNLTLLQSFSLSQVQTCQPSAPISSFQVILEQFLLGDVNFPKRD